MTKITDLGVVETLDGLNKKDFKLPQDKFILCSLNNSQKYNKKTLTLWSNILKKNVNTVLWLLEDKKVVEANILSFFKK